MRDWVLELCHSRWFYYASSARSRSKAVLELCHSRWFYYLCVRHRHLFRFWNYVIPDGSTTGIRLCHAHPSFWNYVIPDGSTTQAREQVQVQAFWNYVIPDGSTTRRHTRCMPR